MLLTPHELRRIAVAGLTTERSVRRIYKGDAVRDLLRLRVERAAASLGLPVPPKLAARHESRMEQPQRPSASLLSVVPSTDAGKLEASSGAPRSEQ